MGPLSCPLCVSPMSPPSCPCPPGAPQPGGGAGCHADPPQALLDVQARRALAYCFIELLQGAAGTRWDLVAGTFPYGGIGGAAGGDGAGQGQGAFAKSPLRTLLGVGGDLSCAAPSPEQHPLSPAGQRGRRVGAGGCCCPPDVATRPGPPSPAQHGLGSPPPFPGAAPELLLLALLHVQTLKRRRLVSGGVEEVAKRNLYSPPGGA